MAKSERFRGHLSVGHLQCNVRCVTAKELPGFCDAMVNFCSIAAWDFALAETLLHWTFFEQMDRGAAYCRL